MVKSASPCRCVTVQHGHPGNQCPKAATERDGLCKECHDKAANEAFSAFPPTNQPIRAAGSSNLDLKISDTMATIRDSPRRGRKQREERYGKWIVDRTLGGGGQGKTFLVYEESKRDGPKFALKALRKFKSEKAKKRFKREAEIGHRFSHRNIVGTVDRELESNRPYIVTEYCEGGDLGHLEFSQYSILDRLRLIEAICNGVAHAHSQNVTHRDLKPANIFLRADGTPAVGDWGICFLDTEDRLTSIGEMVGPRLFAAPEFEDGRSDEVGPWSDVYSLGKIIYWLFGSKRIFNREKHREPAWDLTRVHNEPPYFFLNELFDKSIVFEPPKRLRNAEEVAQQVGSIIRRIEMNAHPVSLEAPQHCGYCGVGQYQIVQAEGTYEDKAKGKESTGLGFAGKRDYFIMACDHCGNTQIFNVKYVKDCNIWRK
jgi:hypothetical protein